MFIGTLLGATTYFKRKRRRIPAFLCGAAIGGLISQYIFPLYAWSDNSQFFTDDPWKWGIGGTIIVTFSIWYSFYYRRQRISVLLFCLTVFAVPTLYFNARSLALFPLLAALIYLGSRSRFGYLLQGGRRCRWRMTRFCVLALVSAVALNYLGSYIFSQEAVLEHFGEFDAIKYRTQAGGRYGLLLGGRSESLVSISAFLERPLLGYGSWAKDRTGEFNRDYVSIKEDLGYGMNGDQELGNVDALIPTHSFLLGALVWCGIVGGLFWVFMLYQILNRFVLLARRLPFYFVYGTVMMIWDIWFSPFAAVTRWNSAIYLAAFFVFTDGLMRNSGPKVAADGKKYVG
jgi:hypothetical protein